MVSISAFQAFGASSILVSHFLHYEVENRKQAQDFGALDGGGEIPPQA